MYNPHTPVETLFQIFIKDSLHWRSSLFFILVFPINSIIALSVSYAAYCDNELENDGCATLIILLNYAYIHTGIYSYVHVYTYMYIHVHIYIYIYIYIYMYTSIHYLSIYMYDIYVYVAHAHVCAFVCVRERQSVCRRLYRA